jgi:hypothetical protein
MSFKLFSKDTVKIPLTNRSFPVYQVVITFLLIGFLLPFVLASIIGFPIPQVQDELSYTVAADTYAHFRLTNPTPANFESFETPHVLMEPSYISKYPPMQGIFMAVGQDIFGHQAFGIWLSCGLFAAALFWMLYAWTRPAWALMGTVQTVILLGINSYWSQSYWGGMIAAGGGALFFGGFRRLFNKLDVGSTVWMTLGGIVLVNSRPFEGTLLMVIPTLFLIVWLIRDGGNSLGTKLKVVLLPGLLLGSVALGTMSYQFYRVTGNPFKMPYSVHHAQYYPTPLFIFQPINHEATRGNARIRRMYDNYTSPPFLDNVLKQGWLPDTIYLSPIYGFGYLLFALPVFLLSPLLAILLYFSLPMVLHRSRWMLLMGISILFTFVCMSFAVWWDQYHYMAPVTSGVVLLFVEGCRQFYSSSRKLRDRQIVMTCFAVLTIGSIVFLQLTYHASTNRSSSYSIDRDLLRRSLTDGEPAQILIPKRAAYFKYELDRIADKLPGKYVAIVSYDNNFDFHDEVIFNRSDLENAKLIWAHDLGGEKNDSLVNHYNDRKVLFVHIGDSGIAIKPAVGKADQMAFKTATN